MARQVSFSAQGSRTEATDVMYPELWKACAGPLVEVPRNGERVYYFPQGHVEQLEECTKEEFNHRLELFKLPSKILCHVVDIQLKAENDTEEVYALIVLKPEKDSEPQSTDICPELARPRVFSFAKKLTPSDVSTHGGFTIPRKHADECLPPLDMNQPIPSQELVAKDLHGQEWRFKHMFRGQPKRHLLSTGWNTFATAKRLVANDALVFLRSEDGELRVGVRRVSPQQNKVPESLISSHSMHLGVLAAASHALLNESLFVVHYKPQTSRFIIGVNKYLEAVNNCSAVGMRFKMRFGTDESADGRFTGRIVGIENFSPQWEDSRWRSLKVQWDENASIPRPERVSPWEIEPFSVVGRATTLSEPTTSKRPRASEMSASPTNPSFASLPKRPSCVSSRSPPPLATKITETSSGCFLFGVDLRNPPLGAAPAYKSPVPEEISPPRLGQMVVAPEEASCIRSRTKVQMEGVAVGRAVDLTIMSGYADLIRELETLFEIRGELCLNDMWEVVFTDNEGDTMLMGDDPWLEFSRRAKRILICQSERVKMRPTREQPSRVMIDRGKSSSRNFRK